MKINLGLLVMLVIASTASCKPKKEKAAAVDVGVEPSTASELDAVNRATVARFSDEVAIPNAPLTLQQAAIARTAPSESGKVVQNIGPGLLVIKVADRDGFSLVTFDDETATFRRAGWVPNAVFGPPTTARPAPAPPPATAPGRCSLELRVAAFTPSNPACVLNEKVRAGSPSAITFPCAGGAVTANFSGQAFSGTASASRVSLTNVGTYALNGCTYRSVQTISGTPPNLAYTYSETIASGSCKASGLCTAKGSLTAR